MHSVRNLADDRRPIAGPLRLVEALARALVHRSSRTQGVGHLRRGDARLLQANRPINKRSTATLAQTFFDADTTVILHYFVNVAKLMTLPTPIIDFPTASIRLVNNDSI